jgi:hypothetical protein
MTLKITVRNFRAVERADIDGGPIVLVAGLNGAGKSSLLQGVALAATGNKLPPGFTKATAIELVRRGEEAGSIRVDGPDGLVRLAFPKAEIYVEGVAPKLSPIAAGLESIADMARDDAIQQLGQHIKARPTIDDLKAAVADFGVSEPMAEKIWAAIEASGWDASYKEAIASGTKLKGGWEEITGQKRWGSNIGATWRMDEMTPDDIKMSVDDIENAIVIAQADLEKAVAATAIDQAEVSRLSDIASTVAEREVAYDLAKEAVKACEELTRKLEADKRAVELPPSENPMPCPHCGGALILHATGPGVSVLQKAPTSPPSESELKKVRATIARIDGEMANNRAALQTAIAQRATAQSALEAARTAAHELKALVDRPAGDAGAMALPDARMAVQKAQERRMILSAARKHAAIMKNSEIQQVLAPEGLRRKVLVKKLQEFCVDHIHPICAAAKWPVLNIAPDMTLEWDGFAYGVHSAGRRLCIRAILQIAIARLDGSPFIIIDGIEALDKKNYAKLFNALIKLKISALLGQTCTDPASSDLPKLGQYGDILWIEDGVIKG